MPIEPGPIEFSSQSGRMTQGSNMTPKKACQEISALSEEGRLRTAFQLMPQADANALTDLSRRLGSELPADIVELLKFASGLVSEDLGRIDFMGRYLFEFEDAFPVSVPILPDNSGNFWIVDVNPNGGLWGPVFFACHDPLMILLQSVSLVEFLKHVLDAHVENGEDALRKVENLTKKPFSTPAAEIVSVDVGRESMDPVIRQFAKSLSHSFSIIDLRRLTIGSGFSLWNRGAVAQVVRCQGELLWATRLQ